MKGRHALLALAGALAVAALAAWWLWPAPPPPAAPPPTVAAIDDASVPEAAAPELTAEVVRESALDDDAPWDDGGIDYDEDDVEEVAPDEPVEPLEPTQVTGVVLTSNGQPAGGAEVHLEPDALVLHAHSAPVRATADAKGRFTFDGVVGDSASLHATHQDQAADVAIELPQGRPVVVKLSATGAIDFTVVDSRLHPMPGLSVRLSDRDEVYRTLITGDDGSVHFEGVPVGTWAPMVVKYNASWRVRVVAQQRVAVTAKIDDDVDIVGRVVSSAGPLQRLLIEANELDAGSRLRGMSGARTDGDGGFVIPVHPGRWVLTTHHPQWGYARAKVDAPSPPVELRLEPPAALEGTVVDVNGAPVEAFMVRVAPTAAEVEHSLEHRTTRADGRFKFSKLPPGETVVEARRDVDGRKTRVTVGLTSGRATEISLRLPGGSSLKGRVVDSHGKPQGDVDLSASWANGGLAFVHIGSTGEFEFPGIPDGTVELYACKPPHRCTLVKDVPTPQERYELVLRDRVTVSGRVVDGTGRAVPKFAIDGRVFDSGDGAFELDASEPGVQSFTLEVPGLGQSLWAYEVQRDVSTDLGTLIVLPRPRLKLLLRGSPCEHCGGMLLLAGRAVGLRKPVFEEEPRFFGPIGFNFDGTTDAELPPVGTNGFTVQAGGMVGGALWQHLYPLSPGLNTLEITAGSP